MVAIAGDFLATWYLAGWHLKHQWEEMCVCGWEGNLGHMLAAGHTQA